MSLRDRISQLQNLISQSYYATQRKITEEKQRLAEQHRQVIQQEQQRQQAEQKRLEEEQRRYESQLKHQLETFRAEQEHERRRVRREYAQAHLETWMRNLRTSKQNSRGMLQTICEALDTLHAKRADVEQQHTELQDHVTHIQDQVSKEIAHQNRFEKVGYPKPSKKIVLLGNTGDGKSTLGNRLLGDKSRRGDEGPFDTSAGADSKTQDIEAGCIRHGDTVLCIIDTPGLLDSDGNDRMHANALVNCLHGINEVGWFLFVKNGKNPRLKAHDKRVLCELRDTLGLNMWSNVLIVRTFIEDDDHEEDILEQKENFLHAIGETLGLPQNEYLGLDILCVGRKRFKHQVQEILNYCCRDRPPFTCDDIRSPLESLQGELRVLEDQLNNLNLLRETVGLAVKQKNIERRNLEAILDEKISALRNPYCHCRTRLEELDAKGAEELLKTVPIVIPQGATSVDVPGIGSVSGSPGVAMTISGCIPCDNCEKIASMLGGRILYCPKGQVTAHPEGYALCKDCVVSRTVFGSLETRQGEGRDGLVDVVSIGGSHFEPGKRFLVRYNLTRCGGLSTVEFGQAWIGIVPECIESPFCGGNTNFCPCRFTIDGPTGEGFLAAVEPGRYAIKIFTSNHVSKGIQIGASAITKIQFSPQSSSLFNERYFTAVLQTQGNRNTIRLDWNFSRAPRQLQPVITGDNTGWIGVIPTSVISRAEQINDAYDRAFVSVKSLVGNATLDLPENFSGDYSIKAFTRDNGGTQIGASIPLSIGMEFLNAYEFSHENLLCFEDDVKAIEINDNISFSLVYDLRSWDSLHEIHRFTPCIVLIPSRYDRETNVTRNWELKLSGGSLPSIRGRINFTNVPQYNGPCTIKIFSSLHPNATLITSVPIHLQYSEACAARLNEEFVSIQVDETQKSIQVEWNIRDVPSEWNPKFSPNSSAWIGLIPAGECHCHGGLENFRVNVSSFTLGSEQGRGELGIPHPGEFEVRVFTRNDGGTQIGVGIPVSSGLDILPKMKGKISLDLNLYDATQQCFIVPTGATFIDVFWALDTSDALEFDGWIGLVQQGIESRREKDHQIGVYSSYFYPRRDSGAKRLSIKTVGSGVYDLKCFSMCNGIQIGSSVIVRIDQGTEKQPLGKIILKSGQQATYVIKSEFNYLCYVPEGAVVNFVSQSGNSVSIVQNVWGGGTVNLGTNVAANPQSLLGSAPDSVVLNDPLLAVYQYENDVFQEII